MLETELQSLKAEVALLRESINGLTATIIGMAHAALPTTPVQAPVALQKLEVIETSEGIQPVEAPVPAPVTIESLQEFCTTLVRKDPDLKPKIKALIASFDGAKVISKVPSEQLPQLKTALEALQ